MAVIVVSDTSPLNYLRKIGRLELLPQLFGEVLIPSAVRREWERDFAHAPSPTYDWLRVVEPRDRGAVSELRRTLDEGEAEAIVLAEECGAELLLIDETDGRAVAENRGLTITGVLGVFVRAKDAGRIPAIRPEIGRLLAETNFYSKAPLLNRVLALAGDPPITP